MNLDNTKKYHKKELIYRFLLFICVFISFVIFFSVVHPMYIYDMDDWTYISWHRHGLPSMKQFNPSRVLPEILMPVVSDITAKVVVPITGDYIGSLSWTFAIVLSIFIIHYFYLIYKLIEQEFNVTWISAHLLLVTLILLHFYFIPETYVFYSINVTCYFNYIIPALLNMIVVFSMIRAKNSNSEIHTGLLLLGIYLCIFSNMLSSAVLMSYTAYSLLKSMCKYIIVWRKRIKIQTKKDNVSYSENKTIKFVKENTIPLLTSVLWIFAAIMELQGTRANQIGNEHLQITECIKTIINYILQIRRPMSLLIIMIIGSAFMIYINNYIRKEIDENDDAFIKAFIRNMVCMVLIELYLIGLCSKAGSVYLTRGDVNIDWIFFLFLMLGESLAYIINKFKKVLMIVPLGIFLIVCEIHISTYPDHMIYNYSSETVKALDENILAQVLTAQDAGETSVKVHVPKYQSTSNWPIPVWGGSRISDTLYRHGITYIKMDIELVPDEFINEKYHLN